MPEHAPESDGPIARGAHDPSRHRNPDGTQPVFAGHDENGTTALDELIAWQAAAERGEPYNARGISPPGGPLVRGRGPDGRTFQVTLDLPVREADFIGQPGMGKTNLRALREYQAARRDGQAGDARLHDGKE